MSITKIKFFSPKFNILNPKIKKRYKCLRGGRWRGSGKSWAVAAALVGIACEYRAFIVCAREIQKSIKESSRKLIVDTIDRYRLNDQFIDWNSLELTNWYQYGELNDRQYLNSLKRKFNVNRVQLPRQSKTLDNSTGLVMLDTRNSLNRIRSTWSKLKLSHKTTAVNINKKFDMQDLTVTYTI